MLSGTTLPRLRPSRLAVVVVALASLLALLAFAAPASQAEVVPVPVTADAVLLETASGPWSDEFNEEAMEAVFGTGWELKEFATVQADEAAGGLFAAHVHFIWIEGSDEETEAAKKFVTEHEAALKAFVARGGRLLIDSATNQELTVEYDGRTLGLETPTDFTGAAAAVDPSHPIFNGPATPNATSFTGDSFAHGRVLGPGLTPLIVGTDSGGVVLADYTSGLGRVGLGTMTAVEFQEPEAAAKSLRINLLTYLLSPLPTPPAPIQTATPPAPEVHCVVPKLKGKRLKAAKRALRRAHCKIGKVTELGDATAKTGTVVKQRPKPGKVLAANSAVRVKLADQ